MTAETAPDDVKPRSVNWLRSLRSSLRNAFRSKPRGLSVRRRRLALTAQIIVFNLVALIVFIVAVGIFQGTRSDLVDERTASVTAQAHNSFGWGPVSTAVKLGGL